MNLQTNTELAKQDLDVSEQRQMAVVTDLPMSALVTNDIERAKVYALLAINDSLFEIINELRRKGTY